MPDYTPTRAPKSDARCWPLPCRDYHGTYAHESGEDPCSCPCHPPTEAAMQAGMPDQVRGVEPCPYRVGKRVCTAGPKGHAGRHEWPKVP